MSGTKINRPIQLKPGMALNRRDIEELFLWASRRSAQLDGDAMALKQVGRQNHEEWAVEEFYFDFRDDGLELVHGKWGSPIRGVKIDIDTIDSFSAAEIAWSVRAKPSESSGAGWLVGWPVINGRAVWGAIGAALPTRGHAAAGTTLTQLYEYSIGAKGSALLTSGASSVGLQFLADGKWDLLSVSATVRTLHR